MTTFSLRWKKTEMYPMALAWIKMHYDPNTSSDLSTACRLSVTNESAIDGAIIVGGQFYGNQDAARAVLKPLYMVALPIHEEFTQHVYLQNKRRTRGAEEPTISKEVTSSLLTERLGFLPSSLLPKISDITFKSGPYVSYHNGKNNGMCYKIARYKTRKPKKWYINTPKK